MAGNTIGERISEELNRLSLTEAAFGELCGHNARDVKAWESGRSYPSAPALRCLAENGVDVFYVLTGRVGPRSNEQSDLLKDFQNSDSSSQDQLLAQAVEYSKLEQARRDEITQEFFGNLDSRMTSARK